MQHASATRPFVAAWSHRVRWYHLVALLVLTCVLTVATGAFVLAYQAAASWTHPDRSVAPITPADYGMDFEEIDLHTTDGLRLSAWYVPSHNGAALVMVHGRGGNRGGDLGLARDLSQRGYGLLLLDLRGHGSSEGEVTTLGVREVEDVRAAVTYLRQRPELETSRLGVYGSSLGGAVAIMSAAELPELRAVVSDSSFASIQWVVDQQFEQLESAPRWLAPGIVAVGGWQACVDPQRMAPVDQIGRVAPRPVMIIHGDQDRTFLWKNAILLSEAAREPKEVWIDPGVGHERLYTSDPTAYVDRVAGFFDHWLASSAG